MVPVVPFDALLIRLEEYQAARLEHEELLESDRAGVALAEQLAVADAVTAARLRIYAALIEQGWAPPYRVAKAIRLESELVDLGTGAIDTVDAGPATV